MPSSDITQRLPRVNEVVVMGARAAHNRPAFKLSGFKKLAIATVAVGGLAMGGLTSAVVGLAGVAMEHGAFRGPEQTATAKVVAKINHPGGAMLSKSYFEIGKNKVWQPMKDAVGSSRQLVLDVDGQAIAIAVSPEIYDQYCKKAEMMHRGGQGNTEMIGACGDTVNAKHTGHKKHSLDTVEVSYTRSDADGSIEITKLNGQPEFASGFFEKLRLKRGFEKQIEVSSTISKAKGPG